MTPLARKKMRTPSAVKAAVLSVPVSGIRVDVGVAGDVVVDVVVVVIEAGVEVVSGLVSQQRQ